VIVEVHRALDKSQAEQPPTEIQVGLRLRDGGRDMMQMTYGVLHDGSWETSREVTVVTPVSVSDSHPRLDGWNGHRSLTEERYNP
jgi:hypothetical protein